MISLAHRLLWTIRGRWFRKEADAFIVSFPKSGRTWLRVLLGKVLVDHFRLNDDRLVPETYKLSLMTRIVPTKAEHDDSATKREVRWQDLEQTKERYRGKKVLFLIRDPRDVAVSCYFQASQREGIYQGSLPEFIRDDRFGVRKIVAFDRIWHDNRNVPREFLLLRYEDMHANPARALAGVLAFLDVQGVAPAAIDAAVAFAKFENMRKLEATQFFDRSMLRPADPAHEDSYKVRRGKVAGYRDYLSPDDGAEAERIMAEHGSPFTDPYLQQVPRAA